jgi:hypothetical protein
VAKPSQSFDDPALQMGPYAVAAFSRPTLTAEQFQSMSQENRERVVMDRHALIIQGAALEDSQSDQSLDKIEISIGKDRITVGDAVRVGSNLPEKDRMELVREVLNSNVRYSSPEQDANVPRREGVPLAGEIDYAQTSRETLTRGTGDCEDFAILGADLLRRMGTDPANIQVLSGTVYNSGGEKLFDHANLAVRSSDNHWRIMELVNDKQTILSADSYLQNGHKGYYFVPSVAIDGNMNAIDFSGPQNPSTPKSRFEEPLVVPDTPNVPSSSGPKKTGLQGFGF